MDTTSLTLQDFPRNVQAYVKVKQNPLQTWTGPEGSSRLRLPDFKIFGTGYLHFLGNIPGTHSC